MTGGAGVLNRVPLRSWCCSETQESQDACSVLSVGRKGKEGWCLGEVRGVLGGHGGGGGKEGWVGSNSGWDVPRTRTLED